MSSNVIVFGGPDANKVIKKRKTRTATCAATIMEIDGQLLRLEAQRVAVIKEMTALVSKRQRKVEEWQELTGDEWEEQDDK